MAEESPTVTIDARLASRLVEGALAYVRLQEKMRRIADRSPAVRKAYNEIDRLGPLPYTGDIAQALRKVHPIIQVEHLMRQMKRLDP